MRTMSPPPQLAALSPFAGDCDATRYSRMDGWRRRAAKQTQLKAMESLRASKLCPVFACALGPPSPLLDLQAGCFKGEKAAARRPALFSSSGIALSQGTRYHTPLASIGKAACDGSIALCGHLSITSHSPPSPPASTGSSTVDTALASIISAMNPQKTAEPYSDHSLLPSSAVSSGYSSRGVMKN